jgi:hypothetical protein
MRETARLSVLVGMCTTLVLSACGGGGGSSAPPPPNPLYVSARTGDDMNSGDRTHPLATVFEDGQRARRGYTVIVGSGTYTDGVTPPSQGAAPQGVQYIADVSGTLTGDPPGPVVINASQSGFGFKMNSSVGGLIDGFTITGATDAGIVLKSGSNNFTIQNCIIHDNLGDANGIRVQDCANVLVFNNLVYNSGADGIRIAGDASGSNQATVVNNTVYGSSGYGIAIGTTKAASPGAFVRNNLLQNNARSPSTDSNIKVTSSPDSTNNYQGDYNLVYAPDKYSPQGVQGQNDINADARLVNPQSPDGFYLLSNSPAIDHGGSLPNNLETVDENGQSILLRNFLAGRTTTGSAADTGTLDIGYHYP